MGIADVQSIFIWWGVFFLIGILVLPISQKLFSLLLDKGYFFSKVLGIGLLSYLLLTTGALHLISFSTTNAYFLLATLGIIAYLFLGIKGLREFKPVWKVLIFEELFFLGGIFFWSWIRSFQPDIHGLEKYMDFGFINSILRTTYFPPKDMWYTPLPINYYYFGHLATAVLTRLSFLSPSITFNLMVATIFSFALGGAFVIGATLWQTFLGNVVKKVRTLSVFSLGIITSILLAFGGNLHTIYLFFTAYQNDNPVPPWQLAFSPLNFPNNYWYPNATRFIYHTIHEFPIYSFVVSDLHGHVLDIPFVLTTIAFLLVLLLKPFTKSPKEIFYTLVLGFMVSVMYMTNAWDGLIYMGLGSIILVTRIVLTAKGHFTERLINKYTIFHILILVVSYFVFALPFSLFFNPSALVGGIGINCSPTFLTTLERIGPFLFEQGYCQHSPLWQLVILYGFFYFWGIGLMVYLFANRKNKKQFVISDLFVTLLFAVATVLIIIPEFAYMKDIYTTYFRANTMFKLVYQAFMMLCIVSAYAIARLGFSLNKLKGLVRIFTSIYYLVGICLLALVLLYPYFAINSYYNNLKTPTSLNGTAYLSTLYPTDYKAIVWLNANIAGQPVILEANGDSYTDYARVSANTGLPTVIGWPVHEWLWRGSYNVAAPRIVDVQTLYETKNIATTKELLRKYNVEYVFIGDLERKKYVVDETKFQSLGKAVFMNGETVIYKINPL